MRPDGRSWSQWLPLLLPVLLVAIWQWSTTSGAISSHVLPTPISVAMATWSLVRSGELLKHLLISAGRAFAGFAIGGAIGFGLGVANGYSTLSERLFDTTLQMVRNVPHLALIPMVIIWFGLGEGAKVFLVALGVFFPVYVNTFHGVRSIDPALVEMARVFELAVRDVPPRHPARRHPLGDGRAAVRPRAHVAHAHRRGDDRRRFRHWLPGHVSSRVHANRHRRGEHRGLRAAREVGRGKRAASRRCS